MSCSWVLGYLLLCWLFLHMISTHLRLPQIAAVGQNLTSVRWICLTSRSESPAAFGCAEYWRDARWLGCLRSV